MPLKRGDGVIKRQQSPTRLLPDDSGAPGAGEGAGTAFRYQRLLDEGRYASISEMAAAEQIERGYLGSLLRLTLLAPDLVEAVLGGRQAEGTTLPRLLEPFPSRWSEQHVLLSRKQPSREGRTEARCHSPRRP
jgi:hypothetical protein